ncbi:hypothetical protein [Lysinibacillus fusiformis]|uniref:hypothetical protein n=1 Tax=Lysinibacillus fusiformis TaxID=28031 RepID=UPI00088466D4|nr:hypothetical protein [Lysinibacillus fusiformis]SCX38438.1 hypothetical protein SAMN02787108_00292 [Lysinibacillus fusiformis]SDB05486.1 hypothetical protein SAMN02787070_00280 [Lysinibacillus fusiformis]SFH75323.1 hypothetical protein SAMN02787080_00279 [Lysinibacillus fusiformis]SFT29762.1 hypothetical protein SAMN02787099_04562 [Lysinibacillus fusiformis]
MEPAEVIEFMEHAAPNVGDRLSPNMIQRKFRTSYANAQIAINQLVKVGYLQVNVMGSVSFYIRK